MVLAKMRSNSEETSPNATAASTGTWGSIFRQWFIGYFLVALVWFVVNEYEREQERAEERARINQSVETVRDAVRRGETGEAFKRLFPHDHKTFLNSRGAHEDSVNEKPD